MFTVNVGLTCDIIYDERSELLFHGFTGESVYLETDKNNCSVNMVAYCGFL